MRTANQAKNSTSPWAVKEVFALSLFFYTAWTWQKLEEGGGWSQFFVEWEEKSSEFNLKLKTTTQDYSNN